MKGARSLEGAGMEILLPWSRFYSANSLGWTRRISFVAALTAVFVPVGCCAPNQAPGTGSNELARYEEVWANKNNIEAGCLPVMQFSSQELRDLTPEQL